MTKRKLDALRRCRMACEKVEAGIGRARNRTKALIGFHRLQETRRSERIVTGFADHLDTDGIRLQFLITRELGKPQLAAQRFAAGRFIMQHFAGDAPGYSRLSFLLLPQNAVIGDDMAHFVGDHGCDFGRVVREREQAARDIEIAARQCEGIDIGTVENCDAIGLVRLVGNCRQLADDLRHHAFKSLVLVLAAIGREDTRMLLGTKLRQPVIARYIVDGYRIIGRLQAQILAGIDRLATRNQGDSKQAKTNGWFPPILPRPFWQGDR